MGTLDVLQPSGLATPRGYSHVVVSKGPLVHVAGQVAVDEVGATVGIGDFAAQAEQALNNVELALQAAGSDFGSVATLTLYCASSVDPSRLAALRDPLRRRLTAGKLPAITLLFVHALMDPDWLIEIQATAIIKDA